MTVNAAQLRAKALGLIEIANELLTLARHQDRRTEPSFATEPMALANPGTVPAPPPSRDPALLIGLAREHYRNRRRREKIFGKEGLFSEPAWDILLDLFIAAQEGRKVSVMSACIGAAVPSTTALRWIAALEREGLLMREDDPHDARRTHVLLCAAGYAAMVEYFDGLVKSIKPGTVEHLAHAEQANAAARVHTLPRPVGQAHETKNFAELKQLRA